ncbi:hypothetical protein DMENIID0001_167240 [Sergentomyia squamirostris]
MVHETHMFDWVYELDDLYDWHSFDLLRTHAQSIAQFHFSFFLNTVCTQLLDAIDAGAADEKLQGSGSQRQLSVRHFLTESGQ